jgi:hypothetical protein
MAVKRRTTNSLREIRGLKKEISGYVARLWNATKVAKTTHLISFTANDSLHTHLRIAAKLGFELRAVVGENGVVSRVRRQEGPRINERRYWLGSLYKSGEK